MPTQMPTEQELLESKPITRPGGFPSFCFYGRSGSGKTPQIGLMAEEVFKESGGKVQDGKLVGGWRTRLYARDRGGFDTIMPQIELGLVEVVDLRGLERPWVWMAKSVGGRVPVDLTKVDGKWTKEPKITTAAGDKIGCWAFEGLTEWGDAVMADLRDQLSKGNNIGGGAITMLEMKDDGEDFNYAFNNKSHYLMGQNNMNDLISKSMRLPGFLIWTALDLRSNEPDTARQVFGPDVGVGKAMTPKIPQKFTYTWRTVNEAKKGGPPKYVLYLVTHQDPLIPAVTCVCNARYPIDTPMASRVEKVEPANAAEAYRIVKKAQEDAKLSVLDRLSN